jgi:hypothetical protein
MPYHLDYPWSQNPRLMKISFYEDVAADELLAAFDDYLSLLEQSTMPLHGVFSFRGVTALPEDTLNLMLKMPALVHPQRGHYLFVAADGFISFVAKILRHQKDVPIEFVDNEQEAWDFFNEMGIC